MKLIDRPNTTNQYYRLETHLDVVARRIPSFLSLWPFEAKFRGLAQIDFVHKDPATIIGGTGAGGRVRRPTQAPMPEVVTGVTDLTKSTSNMSDDEMNIDDSE